MIIDDVQLTLQDIINKIECAIFYGKLEELLYIKKFYKNFLSEDIIGEINIWIIILTEKKNK